MTDLLKNLAAGARLALFLPVRAEDFRPSPAQFALLALFNFGFWVATAWARAGFEGDFDPSAVSVYLAAVSLVLASALLVSLAYGAKESLLVLAVAFSATDPVFDLAGVALPWIAGALGYAGALYFAFIGWSWIVTLRAAIVCCGRSRPQIYRALAVATAMTAVAFYVIPRIDVWSLPDEDEDDGASLGDERLLHMQGQPIERDLAAIAARLKNFPK